MSAIRSKADVYQGGLDAGFGSIADSAGKLTFKNSVAAETIRYAFGRVYPACSSITAGRRDVTRTNNPRTSSGLSPTLKIEACLHQRWGIRAPRGGNLCGNLC